MSSSSYSSTVDTQMLSTLELLHYCRRFQDSLFAFCFEHSDYCEAVLTDLRVLHAARIRQVSFCASDRELARALKRWNRSGERFIVINALIADLSDAAFIKRISSEIASGSAPLIAIKDFPQDEDGQIRIAASVAECCKKLGADKIFFPGANIGLEIDGKFRSYPRLAEIRDAQANGARFNISAQRLESLLALQERHLVDIVLVQARNGAIYEEVFTHAGSGTLFTREYPNLLRPATEADVRDVMIMMQPYIAEGSLKALTEEDLLGLIRGFTVYSVNGQLVAAAALMDYGEKAELGKLCTLPRFQARGRARALVRELLQQAKKQGKKAVFALTVQPHVAEFFERLGFKPVERETLPESWRKTYDFSRPSRAFEIVF